MAQSAGLALAAKINTRARLSTVPHRSASASRSAFTGGTNATTTAITHLFRTLGPKRSFQVRKRLFGAGIYHEVSGTPFGAPKIVAPPLRHSIGAVHLRARLVGTFDTRSPQEKF